MQVICISTIGQFVPVWNTPEAVLGAMHVFACLRVCAWASACAWERRSLSSFFDQFFGNFKKAKSLALATSFLPQLMQLQLMAMDGSGVCGGKELACVTEKAPPIKCALPCAR